MPTLRTIARTAPDYAAQVAALLERAAQRRPGRELREAAVDVPQIVADILAQVRAGGDRAAAELTSQLDRAAIARTRSACRPPRSSARTARPIRSSWR